MQFTKSISMFTRGTEKKTRSSLVCVILSNVVRLLSSWAIVYDYDYIKTNNEMAASSISYKKY